jgi:transcriptional regulator
MGTDTSVIRGTVDMLILQILTLGPMHGWGIMERMERLSDALLRVPQGSLYASLHRLTREGWIRSYWRETENGRRARYYAITRAGEKQLEVERSHWERLSAGVLRIMTATT